MPRDVLKTYAHHRPSDAGLEKITALRALFSDLHRVVEQVAPASRERSVALTHLEDAAMWAIKAVVTNDPASEVSP